MLKLVAKLSVLLMAFVFYLFARGLFYLSFATYEIASPLWFFTDVLVPLSLVIIVIRQIKAVINNHAIQD